MEAFHYRYHPLAERMRAIVASGELGKTQRVDIAFAAPLAKRGDIRYRLDLAGGAMMDMGCYTVHLLRLLAGDEPTVVSATAKCSSPGVDRAARLGVSHCRRERPPASGVRCSPPRCSPCTRG